MTNFAPAYDEIQEWLSAAVLELGSDAGCYHIRSRTGDRIICQAVTDGLRASHLSYGLDLSDCPAVRQVLSTGRPLAIDNAATDLRVAQVARQQFRLQSILYQPVRIRGALESIAIFSYRRPHAWTEEEVSRSQHLAASLEQSLDRIALRPRAFHSPYELMLSAVPGIVNLVDENLLTQATSQSVDQRRDLDGQPTAVSVDELIRDSDRGHELRQAMLDLFGGERQHFHGIFETSQGSWWLNVRAVPRTDRDDALAVVHVQPLPPTNGLVFLDEERNRLEALGRIASSVAHEVNNALQHIGLSLAEMQGPTNPEERAAIHAATERASRVTSQLLTFARRAPSQFQRMELADFLSRSLELARRSVGGEHVVNLRLRGRAEVRLDLKKMELLLINLCRNAADASPVGSDVTLECGIERRGAREFGYVAVIDRGKGMPLTVAATIGELQTSTKPEGLGAGIGLAVVKQVADDHGGEVVASPEEGGGTRVSVYLPLDETVGPATEAEPAPLDDRTHILIVEDENVIAMLVARNLERQGHRTERCSSLESAKTFFDADPSWADLAIVDLQLGDGTGLEFFDHARTRRPDLRFVAVSGFAERESVLAFSRAGWPVIPKPFRTSELAAAVESLLAQGN